MTIAFDAQRLRAIASEKHGDKTQDAIADRVGIDRGSMSRYLNGKREPRFDRISRMAQAYDIDPRELMTEVAA